MTTELHASSDMHGKDISLHADGHLLTIRVGRDWADFDLADSTWRVVVDQLAQALIRAVIRAEIDELRPRTDAEEARRG